jgi:hypothetical protein
MSLVDWMEAVSHVGQFRDRRCDMKSLYVLKTTGDAVVAATGAGHFSLFDTSSVAHAHSKRPRSSSSLLVSRIEESSSKIEQGGRAQSTRQVHV